MYESFFGFREKPFSLVPDASFFYLSEKHDLALTQLRYSVYSRALITVITGEIGCGKTTLLQKIIGESEDDITIGLLNYTHSSFGDLLQWVLLAFGLDHKLESKVDRYKSLVQFFISEYANNRRTILIVDEAQNMDDDTLEGLRMLSNINVDKEQVLQLVLVGQPELLERLRRPNLSQFAQRIAVDCHIDPMGPAETADYIGHRLEVVGGDAGIFLPETYELVFKHSRGVPRLINIVCDTALLYAYSSQQKVVDAVLIGEAIKDREKSAYFGNILSSSFEDTATPTTADYEHLTDDSKPETGNLQKQHTAVTLSYDDTGMTQPDAGEMPQEPAAIETEPQITNEPTHEPGDSTPHPLVNKSPERQEKDPNGLIAADPDFSIITATDEIQPVELTPQEPAAIEAEPEITNEPTHELSQSRPHPLVEKWPVPQEKALDEVTAADPEFSIPTEADEIDPVGPIPQDLEETRKPSAGETATSQKSLKRIALLSVLAVLFMAVPAGVYMFPELVLVPSVISPEAEPGEELALVSPTNEKAAAGPPGVPDNVSESDVGELKSFSPSVTGDASNGDEIADVSDQRSADVQIQKWLSEVEQYLAQGRLIEPADGNAYTSLRQIFAYRPDHPQALRLRESLGTRLLAMATEAEHDQRWDEASVYLRSLLSISPKHKLARNRLTAIESAAQEHVQIEQWLDEAKELMVAGRLVQPEGRNAYEFVRKILKLQPQHSVASTALNTIKARILDASDRAMRENQLQIAVEHLQDLIKIDPDHSVALSRIETLRAKAAQEEQIRKDLARAETQLETGRLVEPEGDNAYETLRLVLTREPFNSAALEALENVKARLLESANLATEKGQHDVAIAQLHKLLTIGPDHAAARSQLTALEAEVERKKNIREWLVEAEQHLRTGNLLDPPGSNAYGLLQKILAEEPEHVQGLELLSQLTDLMLESADRALSDQDFVQARIHLERLSKLGIAGERVRSKLNLLSQAENTQRRVGKLMTLAHSHIASGRLVKPEKENAYELLSQVLELQPEHPEALVAISRIEGKLLEEARGAKSNQQWNEAKEHFQSLLRLNPDHVMAKVELQEVESSLEKFLRIQNLLLKAEKYVSAGKLTTPPRLNAYETYQQVLRYEPQNQSALAGINFIKETLLRSAQEAKRQRRFESAKANLHTLLSLESNHLVALSEVEKIDRELQNEKEIGEWLKEAREHMQAGRLVAPENSNAYQTLQRVVDRQANNSEALAAIETIKSELLQAMRQATLQRQWEQLQKGSRQLLQIDGDHPIALASLKQAQQQIDTAREVEQWMSDASRLLDGGQLILPPGANAYETLQKVLSREPDYAPALAAIELIIWRLLERAAEQKSAELWAPAASTLREVLVIKPDDSTALTMLAEIESHLQAEREIADWLEKATQYARSGQAVGPPNENAYELLQKVLDRDPDNPRAAEALETIKSELMHSVTVAQQRQQWQAASSHLRVLLNIDPGNVDFRSNLQTIEMRVERERKITQLLQLADMNLKAGRLVDPAGDNAYDALRDVLGLEPDHAEAQQKIDFIKSQLWHYAANVAEKELWEQARRHLESLLLIDPDYPEAAAKLSFVTANIQRNEERARGAELVEILSILKQDENSPSTEAGTQTLDPEEILNIITRGNN